MHFAIEASVFLGADRGSGALARDVV